jgi:hypothetical protein
VPLGYRTGGDPHFVVHFWVSFGFIFRTKGLDLRITLDQFVSWAVEVVGDE